MQIPWELWAGMALQGCPRLGQGALTIQLVGVYAPDRGIALGEGHLRAVPEEVCRCELLAIHAPGSWGNECPVPFLKESEQCLLISTPLAFMRSDTCMGMSIAAIYLAKDWTMSFNKNFVAIMMVYPHSGILCSQKESRSY